MVLLIPTMVEFHDAPDEVIKADEAKEDFRRRKTRIP